MLSPPLGSPDVLNDLAISSRIDSHGILQETVKQLPTMSGSPSIETKRKFVQVVINMFRTDCSLMGTQDPALQQGDNTMYKRQKIVFRSSRSPCYPDFMSIAMCFNTVVSLPAVSDNGAAGLNSLNDEGPKTQRRGIRNPKHPNPSNGFSIFFGSNDNQCFLKGLSTSNAFFKSSQIGFIDLNTASQSFPARSNHGSPDFMKPSPCSFITAKPKNTLQTKGACAIFLGNDPPDCPEPDYQWLPCTFKYGTRYDRHLTTTGRTLKEHTPNGPRSFSSTDRAPEIFRPAQLKQIFSAFLFRGKSLFKLSKCTGVIFHAP